MSEPALFKDLVSPDVVRRIAKRLKAAHAPFRDRAFVAEVIAQLPPLELKDRIRAIAAAIWKHVALPFPAVARVLVASLGDDDGRDPITGSGWMEIWPLNAVVGAYGLDHPREALAALESLTKRASAEFDIRPFLVAHTKLTLEHVRRWAQSDDWRVRRLASEGTRPRLPWGLRLDAFVRDPSPMLPVLERLKDDPEEAVRRSVANHVNDIAKDHPDVVVDLARKWSRGATKVRERLIRHALRTLVKQGHPGALAVFGAAPSEHLVVSGFRLEPKRICVGDKLFFSFRIRNEGPAAAKVVVDYAVHSTRASGKTSAKVFKLGTRSLVPGAGVTITKLHDFKLVSTRTYYAGRGAIELRVNGAPSRQVTFELVVPAGSPGRRGRGT